MIHAFKTHRHVATAVLCLTLTSTPAFAGPTVVPTAEGQIGELPGAGDQVLGPTRGKPKLAVGRTKNGPRSEPIAGPRGREQHCRFIQQSAAS